MDQYSRGRSQRGSNQSRHHNRRKGNFQGNTPSSDDHHRRYFNNNKKPNLDRDESFHTSDCSSEDADSRIHRNSFGNRSSSANRLQRQELYGSNQSLPSFQDPRTSRERGHPNKKSYPRQSGTVNQKRSLRSHYLQRPIKTEGSQCSDKSFDDDLSSLCSSDSYRQKSSSRTNLSNIPCLSAFSGPIEKYRNISVYWDIENCTIPNGKSALLIVKQIREAFYASHTEDEFIAVCDASKMKKQILDDLNYSSVDVIYVNSTSKNAADEELKRKLRSFGERNEPQSTVVILTSDINFVHDIHDLRYKKHMNVILIHNKHVKDALKLAASKCFVYEEFISNLDDSFSSVNSENELHLLVVKNLPSNVIESKVRSCLESLFSLHRGKIVKISLKSSSAEIKFSSEADARNAQCRLQNENVMGSIIKIVSVKDVHSETLSVKSTEVTRGSSSAAAAAATTITPDNQPANNIPCLLLIKMSRKNEEDVSKLKKILSLNKLIVNRDKTTSSGECLFMVNCRSLNEAKKVAKKMNCFQKDRVKVEIQKQASKNGSSTSQKSGSFQEEINQKKFNLLKQKQNKCKELEEKINYLNRNRSILDQTSSRGQDIVSVLKERIMFLYRCEIIFKINLEKLEAISNSSEGFDEIKVREILNYECLQYDKCLPIYEHRKRIIDTVQTNSVFVLAGPPGCGKSTQILQYVLETQLNTAFRKIVCTQPFEHLAMCHGSYAGQQTRSNIGNIIGYQTGKSPNNVSRMSALYVSELTLLEESFSDPLLTNYSCVVVDEAQENSLLAELLLAVLKQVLCKRKDLHVIVISTCARAGDLSKFFDKCPVIAINYPVFSVIESNQTISNDYVKQSIAHAQYIHRSKGNGDILIILPSAADVLRGVDLMISQSAKDEKLKIVPLLLMHNFRDMRNQLEQNLAENLRNVIFIVSGLENVVPLPSVAFVIDSGIRNEISMNLFYVYVESKQIDTKDAEQRAKRAGISFVGECIHLVNHNNPNPSSETVSYSEEQFLPLTLLYIFKKGENPRQFKLNHHLNPSVVKQTIEELTKIGLVENQRITALGERIIAIPLPLHLSILLWNSLKTNVGYEILALSAVAEVMGSLGQVLYKDETQSADLVEGLQLYFKWKNLNKKQREYFLKDYKANPSVFDAIDQKVNEVHNVFKKMNIKLKMKTVVDDWAYHLKRFIAENWHTNICFQQKPFSLRYNWNFGNKTSHLTLKYDAGQTNLPQRLIFERLWKDGSTEYILHYINIGESDLFNFMPPCNDDVRSEQTRVNLKPIGHHLMQTVIMGSNGKRLAFLEAKLSKQIKSAVKLSAFLQMGTVAISVASKHQAKVLKELQKELKSCQNIMKTEILEYNLSKKSATRLLIGKGGIIKQIVMANEFVSLLFLLEQGEKLSDVLDFCKNFGQIIYHSVKEVRKDKRQVVVMFAKPQMAQNALLNCQHKYDVRPRLFVTEVKSNGLLQQASTLQWIRRKNTGTCVLLLPTNARDDSVLKSLMMELIINRPLGDVNVIKEFDKQRILIKNVNKDLTKTHVLNAANQCLLHLGANYRFSNSNVQLTHEAGFTTTDEERLQMEKEIKMLFDLQDKDKVVVDQPNDRDELWNAKIWSQFSRKENLQLCSSSNIHFSMDSEYHHNIFFSAMFFIYYCKLLHPKLQNYVFTNSLQVSLSLFENEGQKGLTIVSQNFEALTSLYSYLPILMKPDVILIDNKYMSSYYINNEKLPAFIAKCNNNKSLFLHFKNLNDSLVMFGPTSTISEIKNYLHTELARAMSVEDDEISIDCSAKGLIRRLISIYGLRLEKLQIPDLFSLKIDFGKHCLLAKGSSEAQKELTDTVTAFFYGQAKEIVHVPINETSNEICPVCNDNINLTSDHSYRLECCGHVYCLPCLKALMINCEPPVLCLFKDCSTEILFRDLKTFQAKHSPVLERLVENSLKLYMKSSTFTICPFPDCSGILAINGEEQICCSCLNSFCASCQVLYHYGQQCREFQQKNRNKGDNHGSYIDDLITLNIDEFGRSSYV